MVADEVYLPISDLAGMTSESITTTEKLALASVDLKKNSKEVAETISHFILRSLVKNDMARPH
ncbi:MULTISPECIES: hypothetical protein [unclassified Colwellia]|uniref:hypothetical protein n=1 Tax=unclassified Colwellia TaxID=196834 RepID=UPI0015F46A75|nr:MULTISPECIES: hypothetical protein [unclassified Colwellia]MBA6234411.1 hypothetical protein [Colwellia sp. MB02u-7]MBA6236832.1 hypothetical protein [Colwellia sp. MB02u-11]MBA6256225.1 hypothetical protein [Colwellia sp. MB3u-28]MBA6260109.1 hypothetical protein [Colwellia sp. MB3u-41]MBA6300028.1 hypothetical protein [Colwellia sp. MB3u-22]